MHAFIKRLRHIKGLSFYITTELKDGQVFLFKTVITLCALINVVISADDLGGFSAEDIIAFREQTITLVTDVEVKDSDVTFYFNNELFTDIQLDPKADYSFLFTSKPTKFITHGWTGSYQDEFITNITDEFKKLGKYNVVKIDYKRIAGAFYSVAVEHAQEVGELIGDFLITQKLSANNVHLIGHSLGSHVVGFAAKSYLNATGTKVARVSGLDPAGPLFYTVPQKRLDVGDGHIVDIHHTNGLVEGTAETIGSLDIFYNGGLGIQPECRNVTSIQTLLNVVNSVSCSHAKSTYYFAQLINNLKVTCTKCDNYAYYQAHLCATNEAYVFGEEDINEVTTGKCYVEI